ncbi:methyltransferase domain-containing protein [Chryseolinea sp. T2]|uniref:class I SAM-dependent methyltransferase n=1 Tax=Chryseolinea sp. T2 TaxID=3129255 RepID=UPI0030783AE7
MELSTATRLIQGAIRTKGPQNWADLGAGSGLFSLALGEILPVGSSVFAVDKDQNALDGISWKYKDKNLVRIHGDVEEELSLPQLDGVLLANVMHYIVRQEDFFKRLGGRLTENGILIIIEYDTTRSNPWVPYPISLDAMKKMAAKVGYDIRLLGTVPSRFNSGKLYSVALHPTRNPGR